MTKSTAAPASGVQPREPAASRYMATVLLVVILVTLLLVAIIWLAVMPKKLIYSIEHSSIDGFNYTTGGGINATFHCLLRSRNPNKRVSFYFDRISMEATYEVEKIFAGNMVAAPFYQPVRNVTDMEVELVANGTTLQGKAAEDMRAEKASGSVKMEVSIVGKIRMKIGVFKVHRTVTARCGPYDVPFTESKGFKRVECDTDIWY